MRNISFALTTDQFKNRTKTVTRRLGWKNLKPGTHLMGCKKCMGLKSGEKIERLGEIRVKRVYRERLNMIGMELGGTEKEGFPDMTPTEFVEMFCKHMKCKPTTIITRIEFEYV